MRLRSSIIFLACAALGAAQSQSPGATGSLSSIFKSGLATTLAPADTVTVSNTSYYFPHLAFGGGWRTTLTYINYSPQPVNCTTTFLGDDGSPLQVPFAVPIPTGLGPGASFHIESQPIDNVVAGWAVAQCSGPIKASLLFRFYNGQGTATGEAGVNGSAAAATQFVTFAETNTGIALANPSAQPANVTINALDSSGILVFTSNVILNPNGHFSANLKNYPGAPPGLSFSGSVHITSTVPIVSLSLNFERPEPGVFSSLPPGDLP